MEKTNAKTLAVKFNTTARQIRKTWNGKGSMPQGVKKEIMDHKPMLPGYPITVVLHWRF